MTPRRLLRPSFVIAMVLAASWNSYIDAAHGQGSAAALRFYGTGVNQLDRVRIEIDDDGPGPDASAPCDVGSGSFTVEFWLRGQFADNGSSNAGGDVETFDFSWINGNIIVDRDIFGGSARDWGISIAGGFIRFGTGDADGGDSENTIEGDVSVLDGAWHHVACVRDASTGRKYIYIDGSLDFESSAGASQADLSYPNNGAPGQVTPWGPYIVLAAEKHDAGPTYPSFNGYMDEFRVWSRALSQADVLATFDRVIDADTVGLVGYYRFEEGSGTSVSDTSVANSPDGELIAGVPGNGEWVTYAANPANTAPVSDSILPIGFTRTTITTSLVEPTVIEFAPDGRLFIGERSGRIRIYQNGGLLAQPLIQIPTNTDDGERGLAGMAVDPDFATNGYLYVYYTSPEPRNRVGRFTVVGNTASPASEFVVWENPDLAAQYHHGGAIAFGPDGNLYIATGDQFSSFLAQDLSNQHGKILRVEPDGDTPPDNPFVGQPGVEEVIWAYGLRNPFRFAFDSRDGRMLIGNVGGNNNNGDPGDSWEELNVGVAGANYGWPDQEGPQCFISDCSSMTFPIWSYQHNDPAYYTNAIQASITAGPVYRASAFPAQYQGNMFVGDYANRWIRRLIFDGMGNVIADPLFLDAPGAGSIVDLEVGPDGALYYVTIGIPWSGSPDVPGVHRIAYSAAGNVPPVVAASAVTPTQGPAPLTVAFSSVGTFDPDMGPSPLTFNWSFGDSGNSADPNPTHQYTTTGVYEAVLTVDDGGDMVASAPIVIVVGNAPTATITQPANGSLYRAGDVINFSGTATDMEDGALPPSAFTWRVLLRHAGHVHPYFDPVSGIAQGQFTIPVSGHGPEDTYFEIQLTVVDSDSLPGDDSVDILPEISLLEIDTVPSGIPVFLDGDAIATPRTYESVIGFQHELAAQSTFVLIDQVYAFQCWSNGGERIQQVIAPEGGQSLVATYAPAAEQSIESAVASNDRNADSHPTFGGGEELANFFDPSGTELCIGLDTGEPWQAGFQFPLAVPNGATITSATLRVVASGSQSGFPLAAVRVYNVDEAAVFDPAHTHQLTAHHVMAGAMVQWVFPSFTTGNPYDSPDLSELVQAIVGRPGWSSGNHIGFVLDGSPTSAENTWRCVYNFNGGQPAQLLVSYATEPDPVSCVAIPTLDQWGAITTGLLLVIGGTIVFSAGRRSSSSVPVLPTRRVR